ncbi:MAG TPA: hypothetical protein VIL36_08335 [Acidimicrobiales bacterium]
MSPSGETAGEEGAGGRRRPLSTIDIIGKGPDTATVVEERRELPRGVLARRIGVALLALFVAVGLTGWLGVRTASRHAERDGVALDVDYARVTRPGLATPLVVEVRQAGGFDAPVVLELDADYLSLFDVNGVHPAPSAEVSAGERVRWEFDPPEGDLLRVALDVRTSPARAAPGSTRIAVLDGAGEVVVATEVDTFIVP